MKRYIIVSCNNKKGIIGDDSPNLIEYFELGWELVKSRLCLISAIKRNMIDSEQDTIITISDRMFLYSAFCKNVISYETFKDQEDQGLVYNLAEDINTWIGLGTPGTVANDLWEDTQIPLKYRYTPSIAPEINMFDLLPTKSILKNNNKYCCMVIRKRDHMNGRGMSNTQLNECFNELKKKKYTVYIMGKGAEQYSSNNNDIHHISLQEMTSLINDPDCKGLITPLSGGGMVRLFTGVCPLLTYDLQHQYDSTNPLWWGNSINFSGLTDKNWKIVKGFDISALNFI